MLGLGFGLNRGRRIGGFVGLLDLFPNAAAAYSLRLLRKDYSGGLVRARAWDGSANQGEADVMAYRVSATEYVLDLNSTLENLDATAISRGLTTSDTLADLVSTGVNDYDGLTSAWYDQSLSNDATQTTAANQPKIVSAGSLVTENGKAAIDFDGVNDEMSVPSSTSTFKFLHDGTSSSVFASVKFGNTSDPDALYGYLATAAATSANTGVALAYDDRSLSSRNNALYGGIFIGGGFSALIQNDNQITPNELKLLSTFLDADNATLSNRLKVGIDGGTLMGNNTFSGTPSTADSTKDLFIGSLGGVNYLKGAASELILYNSDQSTNRTGIETNINTFYSIYP